MLTAVVRFFKTFFTMDNTGMVVSSIESDGNNMILKLEGVDGNTEVILEPRDV